MLLEASGLPKSTWHDRQKRDSQPQKVEPLAELIVERTARHNRCYGYRRMTLELRAHGQTVNHKKVARLMRELGCQARVRRKKYRSWQGKAEMAASSNLLNRDFSAERPGTKLVTDVTEFRVGREKLYLSPVIDLYNREVVAMSMATRPAYALTERMQASLLLHSEYTLRGAILHSDQGWQYRMRPWRKVLDAHGVRQSMSRRGNCLDNAVMESFFAVLKTEVYHGQHYKSVEELETAITEYVHYYNHERIKAGLGGVSPVNYRTLHHPQSLNPVQV
nr:IS3 family transposase [Pantoea sp. A4]